MTSCFRPVVYKRLKFHILHVEKSHIIYFGYLPVNILWKRHWSLKDKTKHLGKVRCCSISTSQWERTIMPRIALRYSCRTCKDNHPTGMHDYYFRKCEWKRWKLDLKLFYLVIPKSLSNEMSVNGKLEAKVISVCCPNLGSPQEFHKDVQNICSAG